MSSALGPASQARMPTSHPQRRYATTVPPEPSKNKTDRTTDALPLHASPNSQDSSLLPTGPEEMYRSLVSRGVIRYDEAQFLAVRRLEELFDILADYEPVPEKPMVKKLGTELKLHEDGINWPSVAPNERAGAAVTKTESPPSADAQDEEGVKTPKGLMIHGPVGTGKSLLLNLFHDSLPTRGKKRVHFHAFMQEIYGAMHRIRTKGSPLMKAAQQQPGQPASEPHILLVIALDLVRNSPILLLDEFQAPDPATTSILSTLLSHFFELGGVLLATSNKKPGELGTIGKGLGKVVEGRMDGWEVSGRDWRVVLAGDGEAEVDVDGMDAGLKKERRYWIRGEPGWEEGWASVLERAFGTRDKAALTPFNVPVLSRTIPIPHSLPPDHTACLLPYQYLLTPLGPLDLLHLCRRYDTVVIEGVPVMGLKEREAARRLITFLDAAYEGGVRVYFLADKEPENLFRVKQAERTAPLVQNKPAGPGSDGAGEGPAMNWFNRDPAYVRQRSHRAAVSDEADSGPSREELRYRAAEHRDTGEQLQPEPHQQAAPSDTAAAAEEEEDNDDIMLRETVGAAMAITARDLAYRRRSPFLSKAEQELIDKTRIDTMTIFTAEDELFAFKRASSRLREMCWSPGYWERSGPNRGAQAALDGLGGGLAEGQQPEQAELSRGQIDDAANNDWGDEASYAGYLKQYTRFNHMPDPLAKKEKMKPFGDWHFFGMQNEEDSWSVKNFFRILRKRYEPPPADFKIREKDSK